MCGIVGVFNSNGVSGKTLFQIAISNRHRGDDGVGFAYRDDSGKIVIRRLPFTLKELNECTLNRDRARRKIKIGVVSYLDVDEDLYKKMNAKFRKEMEKILNRKYDFAFLHHRGASVGDATPNNIHPIVVNNKLYFHNGTVYGTDLLRIFFEDYFGIKFKSETDTEVIAHYINLLSKKGDDIQDILETIDAGVILQVSNNSFTIYRTPSRRLWLLKSKLGDFLVSEVNPEIMKILRPKEILLITTGKHTIDLIKTVDYTKEAYQLYNVYSKIDEYDVWKTCTICNKDKPSIYDSSDYKRKCFECALINGLKEPRRKTYSTLEGWYR